MENQRFRDNSLANSRIERVLKFSTVQPLQPLYLNNTPSSGKSSSSRPRRAGRKNLRKSKEPKIKKSKKAEVIKNTQSPPATRCEQNDEENKPGSVDIKLSPDEEFQLLERAEFYVASMTADPDGYEIKCSKENHQAYLKFIQRHTQGSPKTKFAKRRSNRIKECFVTHLLQKIDKHSSCTLPEGTRLFKPEKKLVEIVAEVLYHSPEGVLQVSQIYTALQQKYPYFLFMYKSAISSWKSSIRHALFQKWFVKVRISTDSKKYEQKGCYWALDTNRSPKDWTMPGMIESSTSNDETEDNLYVSQEYAEVITQQQQSSPQEVYYQPPNDQVYGQLHDYSVVSPPLRREYDPVLPTIHSSKARRRLVMSEDASEGSSRMPNTSRYDPEFVPLPSLFTSVPTSNVCIPDESPLTSMPMTYLPVMPSVDQHYGNYVPFLNYTDMCI